MGLRKSTFLIPGVSFGHVNSLIYTTMICLKNQGKSGVLQLRFELDKDIKLRTR